MIGRNFGTSETLYCQLFSLGKFSWSKMFEDTEKLTLGCLFFWYEVFLSSENITLLFIVQISGALIEISDSKSSRGDRIALISGTSEQKRTAENLIQAFIMATWEERWLHVWRLLDENLPFLFILCRSP